MSKLALFARLLDEAGEVAVTMDARVAGVELPDYLLASSEVCLIYGRNLPVPIPDLRYDEQGIRATLSFARTPTPTFVPWTAVWRMVRPTKDGGWCAYTYRGDMPAPTSRRFRHLGLVS